jgi:hypothetical protein
MAGVLYRLGRLCANRAVVAVFQWAGGLDLVGLSTPYGTVPIAS